MKHDPAFHKGARFLSATGREVEVLSTNANFVVLRYVDTDDGFHLTHEAAERILWPVDE